MDDGAMAMTVFALPLTIVAGRERDDDVAATLRCVLSNAAEIATLLREHGALLGNQTFALANTLIAADAIDIHNLPSIYAWRELRDGSSACARRSEPPLPGRHSPYGRPCRCSRRAASSPTNPTCE